MGPNVLRKELINWNAGVLNVRRFGQNIQVIAAPEEKVIRGDFVLIGVRHDGAVDRDGLENVVLRADPHAGNLQKAPAGLLVAKPRLKGFL